MPPTISTAEKLDILLALSLVFEMAKTEELPAAVETAERFAGKAGDFLPAEEVNLLRERALAFDKLPPKNRQLWQTYWLDKIKRRGRSTRLDALTHPSQIVGILKSEPKNIQALIIRNLPTESQLQIAAELKIKSAQNQNTPVREDVLSLIRQNFLNQFVAFEDVFEPAEIDQLNYVQIENFIFLLGIRETAIACRGIKSKEALAVFLNRFDKHDSHEIARFLTELEKIKPFWVVQADRLMRQIWTNNIKPHDFLQTLGLKLFALAYTDRDQTAQSFTGQKMTVAESEQWFDFVRESEADFENAGEEERQIIDRRRKIIQRLAVKFAQTENL